MRYVLGNAAIHARREGRTPPTLDPFARGPGSEFTAVPRTWLLRRQVRSPTLEP